MPRVEKCYKTLYKIMTGDDEDGVIEMELGKTKDSVAHGLGLSIRTNPNAPLITCINDHLHLFTKFAKKNVTIVNELLDTPPFPAWKDGSRELWN